MRPERAVVKKALIDAGGNKAKASALLGCSRQSLYTWCYQFGLERLAGIRIDNKSNLDNSLMLDTNPRKVAKVSVYSAASPSSSLPFVESTTSPDYPIQVALRIKESLWRRVKIQAIKRGVTLAAFAEEVFEGAVERESQPKKAKAEK